jgi:hypothetical protein
MQINNLLVATHPAFRELSAYAWQEHLNRRPAIDAKMNPLRLKAWQQWCGNLDADDPRRNRMPPKLLEGGNVISNTQNQNKNATQIPSP